MTKQRWGVLAVIFLFLAAGCGDTSNRDEIGAVEQPGGQVADDEPEQVTGPELSESDGEQTTDTKDQDDGQSADVEASEDETNEPENGSEVSVDNNGESGNDPNESGNSTRDTTTDEDESTPNGETASWDRGQSIIEPVFLFPAAEGDSGEDVKALQSRLANLGFAPGTPDGSYGRRTTKAVAAFQQLVDLEETGEADEETIVALRTYRYDGLILLAGAEGPEVEALQNRLAAGPFDPGPIDGEYGTTTVQAVWALEKLAGMPVDGNWGPLDEKAWELLEAGRIGRPSEDHEARWVEVDLTAQLVKVYDPGETSPTLISHVSSGSGVPWSNEEYSGSSVTPTGEFEISRRIRGWRESSLNIGRLYNPLYFNGGIAFHGATSVPLYPASHGCIRVPMHVAEYLPEELPNGTTVHVDA